jgi:peptidoglycan/xylan/chitin deacetylase (PgdA/CDA1 family)
MVCRWLSTICAAAAVFAPALRLGHDGRVLGRVLRQPQASAAEAGSVEVSGAPSRRGGCPGLAPCGEPEQRAEAVAAAPPGGLGETSEGVPAPVVPAPVADFGYGPQTPFFPAAAPRELLLSFDDGPDLKYTPLVLDELDRWGIKAIFFVTGNRLTGDRPEDLARRELVRKIAARGHLVSNHTLSHRDLCRFPDQIAAEVDGNSEVIAATTGVRPLLFRAPYGSRCKSLEAALAARNLVSVGWNLDPQDWKNVEPDQVLAYLESRLGHLAGRGILLLHDTHPSSVFALGPLLEWMARENRVAVRDGRSPIVVRDYSILLPARAIPETGLGAVMAAVGRQTPDFSTLFPSFLAER